MNPKIAKIGNSQTLNRKLYAIKLKHTLKKSSMAELQITLQLVSLEIAKRQKGKSK